MVSRTPNPEYLSIFNELLKLCTRFFNHNLYHFLTKIFTQLYQNHLTVRWQVLSKYPIYPKPICVICSLLRNQKVIFFQGYHKQISQDQELCVFSFFPSQILDDGTYWEKRTLRGNTEKTKKIRYNDNSHGWKLIWSVETVSNS